jgi:hypothetical protein
MIAKFCSTDSGVLYGPLRSTFATGTLSLGAVRGGFKDDVGRQLLRFFLANSMELGRQWR